MPAVRSWSLRLVALAFAAAVVLAGALALEARRATERHRLAAETTLRGYADYAALTFRQRFIGRAWLAVDAVFRPVGRLRLARRAEPPPLDSLRLAAQEIARCADCATSLEPRYYFRLGVADNSFELLGPPLSPDQRAHLIASVRAWPGLHEMRIWDYGSLVDTSGGGSDIVFLTVSPRARERPEVVYGFAVPMETVAAKLLRPALAEFSLLPVPLPRTFPNDSVVSIAVLRHDGSPMMDLTSRWYPDQYSTRIHGSRFLGALTLRLALNPQMADRLLVGGLPRSRTPVLAGMALLAAILIGTTLVAAWRALELARLRSEFVASVSHELRTPLAQILLFGESLTLGRIHSGRDVRSAGGIIVGEARRLMRLIDNVMLFGSPTVVTPVSRSVEALAPLLRETVDAFAPIAAATNTRIATPRVDDVAAPVDRAAMRQLMLNLLDNAVKYGPQGQTVSVGLAAVDGHARLWIEDEGPGIPLEDRERVWRPFVRLRRDVDGQTAGSGIGLSLVREIVARHRGTAHIEPSPSGGARVVIDLPDARPAETEGLCAS